MRKTAFIIILLLCCSTAHALIRGPLPPSLESHTIEALTDVSPLIITTTVDKRYGVRLEQIDLRDTTVLKAPAGAIPPTSLNSIPYRWPEIPWPPPGTRILIFLEPSPFAGADFRPCDFVILDPPGPATSALSPSIFDLSLKPLTTSDQILAAVQRELKRIPPTAPVESHWIYPFHLTSLPADDRLLPAARQWIHSADPMARLMAANILQNHPERQDIPALNSLLDDPYSFDMPYNHSPWSGHEYLIRQAAVKALAAQGVTPRPPVLSTPREDLRHPLNLWFYLALFLLPPLLYGMISRRLHDKRTYQKTTFKRTALSTLTCLSIWMAILTSATWLRSQMIADTIVYATHGTQLEIDSFGGLIYVSLANPWPAESACVRSSVEMTAFIPRPWEIDEYLRPGFSETRLERDFAEYFLYRSQAQQFFPGFSYGTRSEPTEPFSTRTGIPRRHTEHHVVATYAFLVLALLAFPFLRLLWQLIRTLRRWHHQRRQRRAGLCPICSYDLRAHNPGDKCPECGTLIPAKSAPNPSPTHSV